MTDDNVAHLRTVPTVAYSSTEESYLAHITKFLADNEILEEFDDTDVELEKPTSDERRLGPLTAFEKTCFIMGQLLNEIVRSELIEVEAKGTDAIAKIMREQRVSMLVAAQQYSQSSEVPEETRWFLNKCAVTQANVLSAYEWSVRVRYNEFDHRLIVREGFVAYQYGH